MDYCPLNLVRVANFGCEQCLFCPDIKLGDLAVFELQEVHLITHTLYVEDAVSRNFYDLLACRLSCVKESQHTSGRRSDKKVARNGIDPDSTRDSTRGHLEQHFVQPFRTSEQYDLPVFANAQEHILSRIKYKIFDRRWNNPVTVRTKGIPIEDLIII